MNVLAKHESRYMADRADKRYVDGGYVFISGRPKSPMNIRQMFCAEIKPQDFLIKPTQDLIPQEESQDHVYSWHLP